MKVPRTYLLLVTLSVAVAALISYDSILSSEVLAQVTTAARGASNKPLALVQKSGEAGRGKGDDGDQSGEAESGGVVPWSGAEIQQKIGAVAPGEAAAAYSDRLERQGIKEYQAMLDEYATTTAMRRDGPTVAYVCASKRCAGLADRLLGMTCFFNLAVLEDMPFRIGPQPGGGWELEPGAIPWSFSAEEQRRDCKRLLSWNYWYPLDKVVREWRDFASSGRNETICVQVNQVFDPRLVATNRSVQVSRSRALAMHTLDDQKRGTFKGMEAIAVGTLSHLFKFSDKIAADVDDIKASMGFDKFESVVAVHIRDMITEYRLGIDEGMTSNDFMDIAINCSLRMEREMGLRGGQHTGWLILTDRLVDFSDNVRQEYGHKIMAIYDARRKGVVKPGNTARSRGPERAKANFMALRDTALLTLPNVKAIGRTDGGFARLASLFGAKPVFECGIPAGYIQSNLVQGDQRKQLKNFNFDKKKR